MAIMNNGIFCSAKLHFSFVLLMMLAMSAHGRKAPYDMVVAKDGSGDFTSIQAAIDATKAYPPKRIVIFIKNGVYNEKVEIYSWNTKVSLIGESKEKTIITYGDYFDKIDKGRNSTFHTYTLLVRGNGFHAENLTIENSAGPVGQAVALHVEADRAAFVNCRFLGNQDTIFAAGEGYRQYFENCYIEGTTDYIFGPATALFENCVIHSKADSYITAASTPMGIAHGFVFRNCKLTADEGVQKVYLGRPWRNYARTVFINCTMGDFIRPEAWHNWGKENAEKTTFYGEYGSEGAGANPNARADWAHELKKEDLEAYAMAVIFADWDPKLFSARQSTEIPRDTSYTVQSAFIKLKKDYPYIEIARPSFPANILSEKNTHYRSIGNRKLYVDVFYPRKKSPKGYPGILLIHGGGWRTGDKTLMWPLAQQLAAKGYVAICVEYRLSLEAPYPAAVHDLKAAVRWMRANAGAFQLDTTKIAVLGCSAGGQLAALMGTTNGLKKLEGKGDYSEHSSAVQAIVDIDGVLAFKHPVSKEGKMAAQWLGGTYKKATANWEEASALSHANQYTPPTLFIGSSFPRFLAGRADMIKIMDANGIYSETHIFDEVPHSFWLMEPWFTSTLNHISRFFDRVFSR